MISIRKREKHLKNIKCAMLKLKNLELDNIEKKVLLYFSFDNQGLFFERRYITLKAYIYVSKSLHSRINQA